MHIIVLIVDDRRMVRLGFRALLSKHPDIEVVSEAEDREQALQLARELQTDVIVLDVSMPGMDGFEVLRTLNGWDDAPAMVMCSMHNEALPAALAPNARAFVEKRAAALMLVEAIRRAVGL